MKSKLLYSTVLIFLLGLFTISCDNVLDKENLTAIQADDVWNNIELAKGYSNGIYAALMPGMPTQAGSYSDEAGGTNYVGTFDNPYGYGNATVNSSTVWNYAVIRNINFMLEKIDKGTLSDSQKNPIKGEAYFWRAWAYWQMVVSYGGVPLVLDVQSTDNIEAIQVKRNKTSECVDQIVKDLNQAFELLPDKWTGVDVGRIDKSATIAFKARVMLFYASPQFNPANIQSRWQNAYDVAKLAKEFCESKGKGLFENPLGIWTEELNKEVIMVKQYNDPGATYYVGCLRPIMWSAGCTGWDQATLDLVEAFPLVDGRPWDSRTMSYDTLHRHRDKRFYATIGYNGAAPYLKDMMDQKTNLWTYIDKGVHMDGLLPTSTSFYRVKAVDRSIDVNGVDRAKMDWIEIRFAEVLMTFGEAANEAGNTQEALKVLYDMRNRAGILPGKDNKYGITASTKEEIRKAYMLENQLEFAFENKRIGTLRRLRQWDQVLNKTTRHGLKITLKEGKTGPKGMDNIDDFVNAFNVEKISVQTIPFNVKPEYYFFAIPQSHLEQNPNLEQTKGWPGGNFDPLL
ncbi:RagB/SusD family nutrient uptake outer membrane protein [Dyadobacter sp. LHD-138]|uniref:RagB/SusD family nutrient uptake outer membrane protein n=1 Tax=Dyadobacter sp. LHD-138 TaxID=3071413 RepID=UPI0027E05ED5|nr:RagB/SusD family nutrient uptake outer membrane protein [Dyadobacter sp. LHD-138]MDQ6480656.1 RagB/SusD family nutrient uptake outer membrane protein [Dyadobacter sp. LHD-138]